MDFIYSELAFGQLFLLLTVLAYFLPTHLLRNLNLSRGRA
ncbi:hypothetical protein HMPREF9243_0266 [Aerococcus sp. Group 1]|nr:hypothetical protein HMPREF9243_0266 [Aerococcus sp. Group 1]